MKSQINEYQNNYSRRSKAQISEIKEGLRHFNGTDMFYKIPLTGTRFTNKYNREKTDERNLFY